MAIIWEKHALSAASQFFILQDWQISIEHYEPIDWDLIVYAAREMGLLRPEQAAKLLAECQQFRQGMEG